MNQPEHSGTMWTRIKWRWGIRNNGALIRILLAFSLAGLSITQIRPIAFALLPVDEETAWWIMVPLYLLLMVPLYQFFLLAFGTLLDQFRFFWEKEKRLARWLLRITGLH